FLLVLKWLHAVSPAVTGGSSWWGLLLLLTTFSPVVQPAEKAYDMCTSFFRVKQVPDGRSTFSVHLSAWLQCCTIQVYFCHKDEWEYIWRPVPRGRPSSAGASA